MRGASNSDDGAQVTALEAVRWGIRHDFALHCCG